MYQAIQEQQIQEQQEQIPDGTFIRATFSSKQNAIILLTISAEHAILISILIANAGGNVLMFGCVLAREVTISCWANMSNKFAID